jgi:hypothetical protein
MEMLLQTFDDTEDFRIPIPPDEFGQHLDKGFPYGKEFFFIFSLIQLLEKLIGEVEKFIR